LQLYYGDFRPQILPPWPAGITALAFCARIAGLMLVASGVVILINKHGRTIALLWAGLLLAFIPVFHVPYMIFFGQHPEHLGSWGDTFNTLALAGMAFVVAGSLSEDNSSARGKSPLMRLLEAIIPFGRIPFCITIVAFGVCHFLYSRDIETLIPAWLPWHRFWTYFAGTCLVGSGTAIILKIRVKVVASLLATMIFLWVLIIHIPRAISDPHRDEGNEIESAARALAESGSAFLLACAAGSLNKSPRSQGSTKTEWICEERMPRTLLAGLGLESATKISAPSGRRGRLFS
jgi:uncharacterized membrane protein